MTESFGCDDKDQLVAFLYEELDESARAQVEAHLRRCGACATELAALGGVRQELVGWLPPDVELGFAVVSKAAAPPPRSVWQEVPVWAQAAAAVLVMGVGLAVANVQVRHDEAGLMVTTGWMAPVSPPALEPARAAEPVGAASVQEPWRAELAALEQRLRTAIPAVQAPATAAPARVAAPAGDADALWQRVTALVEESELRQRQELAYRLTQFNRDMEMQRRADLVRIERGVGQMEGRTGAEVARQREMLNYLVRASQRPQ